MFYGTHRIFTNRTGDDRAPAATMIGQRAVSAHPGCVHVTINPDAPRTDGLRIHVRYLCEKCDMPAAANGPITDTKMCKQHIIHYLESTGRHGQAQTWRNFWNKWEPE